jgi:hypothetical protein
VGYKRYSPLFSCIWRCMMTQWESQLRLCLCWQTLIIPWTSYYYLYIYTYNYYASFYFDIQPKESTDLQLLPLPKLSCNLPWALFPVSPRRRKEIDRDLLEWLSSPPRHSHHAYQDIRSIQVLRRTRKEVRLLHDDG